MAEPKPFKGWDKVNDDKADRTLGAMADVARARGFFVDEESGDFILRPDGTVCDTPAARAYVAKHGKPAWPPATA